MIGCSCHLIPAQPVRSSSPDTSTVAWGGGAVKVCVLGSAMPVSLMSQAPLSLTFHIH